MPCLAIGKHDLHMGSSLHLCLLLGAVAAGVGAQKYVEAVSYGLCENPRSSLQSMIVIGFGTWMPVRAGTVGHWRLDGFESLCPLPMASGAAVQT